MSKICWVKGGGSMKLVICQCSNVWSAWRHQLFPDLHAHFGSGFSGLLLYCSTFRFKTSIRASHDKGQRYYSTARCEGFYRSTNSRAFTNLSSPPSTHSSSSNASFPNFSHVPTHPAPALLSWAAPAISTSWQKALPSPAKVILLAHPLFEQTKQLFVWLQFTCIGTFI